jgi:hypothetical protein
LNMATYGLGVAGQIPFTGWTNVLGNVSTGSQPSAPASAGTVAFNGIAQNDRELSRIFYQGEAGKRMKAIWLALTGAAPGVTASANQAQIKGYQGDFYNSLRPIEVISQVNRATTAADVTAFAALLNRVVFPSTYVPDISGNGGGGKGAW